MRLKRYDSPAAASHSDQWTVTRVIRLLMLVICSGVVLRSQDASDASIRQSIASVGPQAANLQAAAPMIAWTVLPVKVVTDNYGHNVSNKYLAVDVLVHNNDSSAQLVIKGFHFTVQQFDYVSTDPPLVRGSIEKQQDVGARNRSLQVVKTIGLLATGSEGYFHVKGASANFNRGVSIFSDPFEKGLELIFPDTTVKYLANWDSNQVFKNGFIVDAGKELTGRIFLPLEIVCSKTFPNPPATNEVCRQGGFFRGARYDANQLKLRLGKVSAIGNTATILTGKPIPETP